MRNKITTMLLVIVMMSSMFCFPSLSLAAQTDSDEMVLFLAQKENDVTSVMPKTTADSEFVKAGKFSAKWAMDGYGTISITGFDKDISKYNELKLTVYANMATSMYVYFETKDSETSGMDYFAYKVNLKEGWQNISVDLSTLSKTRSASWEKIDNISFNSDGWSQTPKAGAVVYFDRISLASNAKYGTPGVTPSPTPTPEPVPEGEAGIARYYTEDFENNDNVDSKYAKDNLITLEQKDGNKFMQITKAGAKDVHVSTSLKFTSRYIVMSADYATTKYPESTQILTCKFPAGQFVFVKLTKKGEIKAGDKLLGTLKADGKFVNIAAAFDFDNSLYSVYIDGELVGENLRMTAGLGYPTMHRVFLAKSEVDAGGNIMVDNIRVFDGKSPEDFDKTISVSEIEASTFEEMVGGDSPIIDKGTFNVKSLDAENAVMMNVRSGYIHANGERYMPDVPAYIKDGRTLLPVRAVSEALGCSVDWNQETRTVTINGNAKITIGSKEMILPDGSTYTLDVPAEITADRTFIPLRALCEKVLGKTVFWDDRGLIILSDKELGLTKAKIVSLNNYMFYDRPSAETLIELFNSVNGNTHPRAILNADDFARILADYKTNEYMKKWGNEVIATAEEHLNAEHETYVILNNLRLLATCNRTLDKALNLTMAYKLTGREEFKTYLWEEMQNVCNNFPDWNHKLHYLDVGTMTTAVAIAYDWLYDEWTEEQRKIMEEGIYKHSLVWTQKAQYGQSDYSHSFVTANTNWNAVCNGGVGVGAVAVFDKYPEICADVLEKSYVSLESMMKEFYPDGAWYEGTSYARYLTEFLAFFIPTSQNAFASDFGITKAPGFERLAQYYLNCDGMTGSNNFHDSSSSHLAAKEFMWFSKHMNQPAITQTILYKMDKYNIAGGIYAFLNYDTSVTMADTIDMPLDTYFGETEIASLRSSWTDTEGVYVSFHSGQTHVNHGHLDSGTFVADLGGQRFAHDLGAEDYNASGYFGGDRYKYYRARPEGHNVFVINPDSTEGQYQGATDKFVAFESKSKGGYGITELSNAYSPYAKSAKRGIMLGDERRSILIRDEIRGMKYSENDVYWFMQLLSTNVEIVDKNTVILEKGGVKVKLQILSDATDWEIEVTPARPLENSPDPASQNKNGGYTRLIIKFKTEKDVNINVKMSLLYDKFGDSPIVDVPLDKWEIPDGDLVVLENPFPEFPKAESLIVNGVAVSGFNPELTDVGCVLPYGETKVESIEVKANENIEVYQIDYPETVPGVAMVTLVDKTDTRLKTTYKLSIRERRELELEASGFQEGNEPEKCLDGDLTTRWAVDGDSYGIFRFGKAKKISSVWIATWKAAQRSLIFDIEVSTDGENFTKVWSGQSAATEDILEEIKIPEGEYLAVKLVFHGTTTGTWNSILEVDFK